MTVTRSLAKEHYTCSAPVKHSCVDPSKFLLPFLGLTIDHQSLRQLTAPIQASWYGDKYFYILETKMLLKYFLDRFNEYSEKYFRRYFGSKYLNYKFLVSNKFQRNFSLTNRTLFSSEYGPMANPSVLPKRPPKIANIRKSEVFQLPDESSTCYTQAMQLNFTSRIVTNTISYVILLVWLTETTTNIGSIHSSHVKVRDTWGKGLCN